MELLARRERDGKQKDGVQERMKSPTIAAVLRRLEAMKYGALTGMDAMRAVPAEVTLEGYHESALRYASSHSSTKARRKKRKISS